MRDVDLMFLASMTLSEGVAMDNLGLALSHEGPVTRLTCTGELGVTTSDIFLKAVRLALETQPSELQVDTTRLVSIAPDGIVVLLQAFGQCSENRAEFRLIAGPIVGDALVGASLDWILYDDYRVTGQNRVIAPWVG